MLRLLDPIGSASAQALDNCRMSSGNDTRYFSNEIDSRLMTRPDGFEHESSPAAE